MGGQLYAYIFANCRKIENTMKVGDPVDNEGDRSFNCGVCSDNLQRFVRFLSWNDQLGRLSSPSSARVIYW